jgi:hypothetical protein
MAEPGGTGSKDSAEAVAKTVAQIKADMAAMAGYAKQFASSMGSAAGTSTRTGRSVSTGANSFSAQDVDATGYSQPQGMKLGPIGQSYATTGMSGKTVGTAAAVGLGHAAAFTGKMGVEAFNDLRVGRQTALDYETDSRIGWVGTGDFSRFGANVRAAMNPYNVQNRETIQRDVAIGLNQGYGQMYRNGGTSTVGERNAAAAIGGYHTLGAMAGMDPNAVRGGYEAINSAPAYYSMMQMGLDTRDPTTGQMKTPEEIVNQLLQRPDIQRSSADQVAKAFAPGQPLGVSLLQATGSPDSVELIQSGLALAKRSGKPLKPGDIQANAKASGAAGTKYTQGLDSESMRNLSEQDKISAYVEQVTAGIDKANGLLYDINEHLAHLDGWQKSAVDKAMQAGGALDTMGAHLPGMTSTATGGLSNIVGTVASLLLGQGLIKGGASLGSKAAGALRGGSSAAGGAGRLGALGRAAGPIAVAIPGVEAATNFYAAAKGSNKSEDLTKTDWWHRVLQRTGEGALAGTMIEPGGGTIVGGVLGFGEGLLEASFREVRDTDKNKSGKGYAEGSWMIEKDQTANIHQGEMIIPNRIAEAVRTELRKGSTKNKQNGSGGGGVTINLTLQRATETEAIQFAKRVKSYLDEDDELESIGSGSI